MMLGAGFRFLATRKITATTHEGILNAAGLITGDAFASLILGIIIVATGIDPGAKWGPGEGRWFSEAFPEWFGAILLVGLLALVFVNYTRKKRTI
jgi:sugar phosphate permease